MRSASRSARARSFARPRRSALAGDHRQAAATPSRRRHSFGLVERRRACARSGDDRTRRATACRDHARQRVLLARERRTPPPRTGAAIVDELGHGVARAGFTDLDCEQLGVRLRDRPRAAGSSTPARPRAPRPPLRSDSFARAPLPASISACRGGDDAVGFRLRLDLGASIVSALNFSPMATISAACAFGLRQACRAMRFSRVGELLAGPARRRTGRRRSFLRRVVDRRPSAAAR